jgi:hypothetical protein
LPKGWRLTGSLEYAVTSERCAWIFPPATELSRIVWLGKSFPKSGDNCSASRNRHLSGKHQLMPGKFIKGALISFMPTFIGSLPNVIVFQFNPETITHTWTAAPGGSMSPKSGADPNAATGVPGETFSFSLAVDASDMIADGSINPVASGLAAVSGVYTRLAALEMLQYPAGSFSGGLLGQVSASLSAGLSISVSAGGANANVPASEVPTVIFVWGPQRIVPVRVTGLTITEKLYDALLNPTHADVQITLRVLTPEELAGVKGELATVAKVAYVYSQGLRQVQALANLGDAAASIIGMLPNPF